MTPSRLAWDPGREAAIRVLVVGNCSVDVSYRVARFPSLGETLLASGSTRDVGGKGANQAVAAVRAGAEVTLCAAVGRDEPGRWLRARLAEEQVRLEGLRDVDAPTDESVIWVTPDGENRIVSTDAAARSLVIADIASALDALGSGGVLLMQGNLAPDVTRWALAAARKPRATTVLNVAPVPPGISALLPLVDIAVVNEIEAEQLTGCRDVRLAGRAILERGARHAVVTIGAAGAMVVTSDGDEAIPVEAVTTVDTTGAGDVFCGVLAASVAARRPLATSARLAAAAATVSVARRGTQASFPTRAELGALTSRMALP